MISSPMTRAILLTTLVFAVSCASPIKTEHDFDPSVNIAAMSTFAWISDEPLIQPASGSDTEVTYVSPIDDQRIRRAVDADLEAKGYRKAPVGEAQLVITYGVGREQKTKVYNTAGRSSLYYPGIGYGYGYGGWYGGSGVEVRQYEEGTLTLQFFARDSKQAVWVGWASKRLTGNDDRQEVVNEAVTKILAKFPRHS